MMCQSLGDNRPCWALGGQGADGIWVLCTGQGMFPIVLSSGLWQVCGACSPAWVNGDLNLIHLVLKFRKGGSLRLGRTMGSHGSLSLVRLSKGVPVYFLPFRAMWSLVQISILQLEVAGEVGVGPGQRWGDSLLRPPEVSLVLADTR